MARTSTEIGLGTSGITFDGPAQFRDSFIQFSGLLQLATPCIQAAGMGRGFRFLQILDPSTQQLFEAFRFEHLALKNNNTLNSQRRTEQ